MKFLCPSCKAKYQIADEKVAGRSVRMKCRKCGYVIQVSSVAGMGDALPGSEPPPADTSSVDASSAVELSAPSPEVSAPAAAPPPAADPPPAPAASPAPPSAAASRLPAVAPARPSPTKPGAPPVRPATPAPRPTFGTGARPAVPAATAPKAPSAKASLIKPAVPTASAPSAAAAPAPAPAALGIKSDKRTIQGGVSAPQAPAATKSRLPEVAPAAPAPAAIPEAPKLGSAPLIRDFAEEEESTRIADVSALAGAFSLAVGGASTGDAKPGDAAMPADEWFVGINGVPVGPIRLSELRSKAASGSVNRDSLVWRDGFEEWRPLKSFPELVAIVDESVSSARASLTPFTPAVAPVTGPTPSVNVPHVLPAAGAPPPPATSSDPFPGPSGVTGAAVVTDDIEVAGVPRRTGSSPAAWIAVAIALLFGLTLGFVFFNRQKTIEVVKYVDRPVPGAASAVTAPSGQVTATEPTVEADPKNPTKHVASSGTGSAKTAASAATPEPDKGISGLKGLSGLSTTGPSRGPEGTGPSGTVGGGGQLDGAQIQSTVARYTSSVKRACWQPALDTRDKDAPTTARVNVTITVLPSGGVSNATTGGDPKGYRGLSQCISSRVRGWQFPPSGDTTTVNVPFVFAAQ